jgi:hypothetical protein
MEEQELMPCPRCGMELDPELEQPCGMFGPFPAGEIICLNCGAAIGVIWGERVGMQHA